jgi:excinuclease UvrABC helicase subunit UvrB
MKIEIDLKDILFDDDYGAETLQESIKRQVIDNITKVASAKINVKIEEGVNAAIQENITDCLKDKMPEIITDILNKEYTIVDNFGRIKETTTFKDALIKSIHENCVYKRSHYSSDNNAFTKAVDAIIEDKLKDFKKEMTNIVDKEYIEQTKAYAVNLLKDKLGLK